MENIVSDLNVSKMKQDFLSKTFEALYSQANGVLLLTVQWKDIESHFNLIRKSFQDKLEEFLERENGIRAKEKQLEAKELDLNLEIGLKAKELGEIDGLIEERSNEIELKLKNLDAIDRMNVEQCKNIERNRQEVDSLEFLIQEKRRELDVTMKKCSENQKWMEEKEREFDRISKSIREHTGKLKFLETSIKQKSEETESKERELQSLCKTLKKYEDDVGFFEGKFNLIQRSIEGSNKELELKEGQLRVCRRAIDEYDKEIKQRVEKLDLIQRSIEGSNKELELKEGQLRVCRRSIDEYDKEIKQRVEKLDLIQRSIEEHKKEVDLKEKQLRACRSSIDEYDKEITQRKDKLNLIRRSIEGRNKEGELKEEQLQVCQRSIDEFNQEIKLKEVELDLIRCSLGTCSSKLEEKEKKLDLVLKEVESKEKNLVSLKTLVDQCAHELEMKEGKFKGVVEELESKERSVQLKIEELDLVRKKVNEYLEELTLKEQNLGLLHKKVEESSRELEIKESEFQKRVNEFELRQKAFKSVRNLMESGANENTNTIHSQVKVEQLECVPPTNTAIVPSPASLLHRLSKDGKCLQVLLNQHFKTQESVGSEILRVLGGSSDPAKLVLDAMEGFYSSDLSGENAQFDLSIVRRSCILLLEQLMKASPQIDPRVREEAMTLAGAWKGKMTVATENYLEVLGFLQLLATYGLSSAFDVDELRNLLDVYRQRHASELQRKASELRATLCITDQAFVNAEQAKNLPSQLKGSEWLLDEVLTGNDLTEENIIAALPKPDSANYVLKIMGHFFSRNWERGDVGFEASVIKRFILLFKQLLTIKPQIPIQLRDDARKLAVRWKEKLRADKENSLEVLAFLQFLVIYNLFWIFDEDEVLNFLELTSQNKEALEFYPILSLYKIPKFIRGLIKRKKLIEAIRLSCMFKLTHKFSPKLLLTIYLEDAKQHTINFSKGIPLEERNEVADKEIASLRTAFQCIKDYDLKSEFCTGNILKRISQLERTKSDRNHSAKLLKQGKEQQQEEQKASKKRRNGSFSAPEKAPQQSIAKCPRTVASTVKSCTMPNSTPALEQMSSFSDFHGSALATDRNSQQFTSVGSNYIG